MCSKKKEIDFRRTVKLKKRSSQTQQSGNAAPVFRFSQ